jgi:hypothetical protein
VRDWPRRRPVRVTLDLDRLVHQWQTSGGQQDIGVYLCVAEHVRRAGAYIGRNPGTSTLGPKIGGVFLFWGVTAPSVP